MDDAMKEALKRKKMKGFDITITIGGSDDEKAQKETDLAPEVKDKSQMDDEQNMLKPMAMGDEMADEREMILKEMLADEPEKMREGNLGTLAQKAKALIKDKLSKKA